MKLRFALFWAILAGLAAGRAGAGEISFSGFGTVGYAQSDSPHVYQRHIDRNGTFERDSVLGLQADARLDEHWGATVQLKLAPSTSSDSRWESTVSWAFLSYRPTDDWLFRAGKLRVPLYLNSENMDVGTTFDFARLPTEMYSLAPTTDFTGLSFSKTWALPAGELNLDGYWGKADSHWRYFFRDDLSAYGGQERGAIYAPIKIDSAGLVVTAQIDEHRFRAGAHKSVTRPRDGSVFMNGISYGNISQFPFFPVYGYQFGAPIDKLESTTLTLGADVALGGGFRAIAELARRSFDKDSGPSSTGAYVALLKESGAWTPYVSVARLLSSATLRKQYLAADGSVITPSDMAPVALIGLSPEALAGAYTAFQRSLADSLSAYDQTTVALGTSYRLSPNQKLKAEWARTHVGAMSSFVDVPAGASTGHKNIDVFSVSYNFVF